MLCDGDPARINTVSPDGVSGRYPLHSSPAPLLTAALALLVAACAAEREPRDRIPAHGPWTDGAHLAADPQAQGDPERGWELLTGGDFMSCGLPYKMWEIPFARPLVSGGFGGSAEAHRLPGRGGMNEDLPYYMTAFTAPDGAEVINGNCLMCHGGEFNGELVVGLPNATADFTGDGAAAATGVEPGPGTWELIGLNATEVAHAERMFARAKVLAPYTNMRTIGMNPAEMYAVVLMAHHDRDTLAWSDEEVTPIEVVDHAGDPITDPIVTSDPPPWWRVHKKNALFYNGMARGDHRGTMALASSVCVDNVARAKEVDRMFLDLQAFVGSLRAPAYPFAVDAELADRGEGIFLENCAGCHGTYAADAADEWYPNLLIPLGLIGTDPVVAEAGVVHSPQLVEWYNDSFYGKITRMEPDDPFPGYMAPPLDGIWATAPFLHNGSVPTIELVLNSTARPDVWRRVDYDSTNYDEDALGWPFEASDLRQAELPADERKHYYDTGYWSQSNAGHTFGDHLSAGERRAVLEYLKTL